MAWSSAIVRKFRWGRNKVHFGTFTNTAGSTGGDIDTGLDLCDFLIPFELKATAPADMIGLNEDFSGGPILGNAITIVTAADVDGYWIAVGR